MQHWALAVDRVRYSGEPVAVVIAEDRYTAETRSMPSASSTAPLGATVDIAQACEADAPVLHEAVGSNVVNERRFSYGDPAQAFAGAARRVALTVHYPRNSCTPMECGVVVAEHQGRADGGHAYEVLSNFMGPFSRCTP